MKWSAEAKVGFVTIVAVLLFSGVIISLAHIELFGKPGFVIHTEFNDANGLQKGNSVRYVGVHVGKVEKVTPRKLFLFLPVPTAAIFWLTAIISTANRARPWTI